MLSSMIEAAHGALLLNNLNKSLAKKGKDNNSDVYPGLKTTEVDVAKWWNSLNWLQKVEVGNLAVHYMKMTPNYCFDCGHEDRRRKHKSFNELKKTQKKIVEYVFKRKDDKFESFPIKEIIIRSIL